MKITAKGQLQHHWWGQYCATIYLRFSSEQDALAAMEAFPTWKRGGQVLGFHGTGAALKTEEARLKTHGADPKKLTSLRYSIDYGEPFQVTVDLAPEPPEVQLELMPNSGEKDHLLSPPAETSRGKRRAKARRSLANA